MNNDEMRLIFFHAELGGKSPWESFTKLKELLAAIDPEPLRIGQANFLIALDDTSAIHPLIAWCNRTKIEYFVIEFLNQALAMHPLPPEGLPWLAKKGFHPVPLAI